MFRKVLGLLLGEHQQILSRTNFYIRDRKPHGIKLFSESGKLLCYFNHFFISLLIEEYI